jgi:hypothetical protein
MKSILKNSLKSSRYHTFKHSFHLGVICVAGKTSSCSENYSEGFAIAVVFR